MSALPRKNQKLFGTTAGANQMASEFGSLAASSPSRTSGALVDPEQIQSLPQYDEGWFAAVLGENSPAIEDMNSLCYLYAYQLTYLFQQGVPEWNTDTVYYLGAVVRYQYGLVQSITNNNTGNPLADDTNWIMLANGGTIYEVPAGNLTDFLNGTEAIAICNPVISLSLTLVDIAPGNGIPLGQKVMVKNISVSFPITVLPFSGQTIDGGASTTINANSFRCVTFMKTSDTNWTIVSV